MTVLPEVRHIRASTLEEALGLIDDDVVPYAGATELVPAMRLGVRRPEAIVDLKRLQELVRVDVDMATNTVRLGAAMTHRAVADDSIVSEFLPSLAEAAAHVGNVRVRNSGTLGGNLSFAEPRSDLSVVLSALDATVELASAGGERTVPVRDLILGAFETCLAPEELLIAVTVPFEPAGMSYWKLQSYERPTVGIASLPVEGGWKIVVGAATERPEEVIIATNDIDAVEAFVNSLDLSDDLSGTPDYKRSILRSRISRIVGLP